MIKYALPFLLTLFAASHAVANDTSSRTTAQLQEIIDGLNGDAREEAISQLKLREGDLVTSVHESKNAEAYLLLGKTYFLAEMDAKAIDALDTALALDASLSEPHFFIGLIHNYAGDSKRAEKSFRSAIAADKSQDKYFVELGRTLGQQGDLSAATTAYENALALNDRNFFANVNLATFYAQEGGTDKAEQHFLVAIEEKPNDVDANYNLGQLYQTNKQYNLAVKQFETVVDLNPNDWRAVGKLVQLNAALGDDPARDAAVETIYEIWRTNKSEELTAQKFYIREQSELENGNLYVLEYFELVGDRARKFIFYLRDEETEDIKFEVSLGSYDATNNISRELGDTGPDERLYHLDGYSPNGTHYTYDFFNGQPTYDVTKKLALEALEGDSKIISGTVPSVQ